MRKLVIDIGNTRTKLGLFEGQTLLEKHAEAGFSPQTLAELVQSNGVQSVIVCAVGMQDPDLVPTLRQWANVIQFDNETALPFRNAYTTPHTLGKDRLAAVAGADALFRGKDCMIVDAGTCIKYELFTGGTFRGGNIAPGLNMRTEAMAHFTAKLPKVEMAIPSDHIGNSTETALQNGAFLGAVLEIMGFYRMFQYDRTQEEPMQVILTGGDAEFLMRYLRFERQTVEHNLTLIGLNYILDWNISNTELS